MKKLVSFLFCIALLFGLTACGSKVDDKALDALETSIANIFEQKAATFHMGMEVSATDEGVAELIMQGAYDVTTANPLFSLKMDMKAEGETMPFMALYIKDNTMYMNMMELVKQKQYLGDLATLPEISFDKNDFKLPKEEMKEYLKKANLDNDKITLEFDMSKIDQEELKAAAQANGLDDISYNKIEMTIDLKDDHIKKATFDLGIKATLNEELQNINILVTLAFDEINKQQSIEFPDFSDYIEADEGQLSSGLFL